MLPEAELSDLIKVCSVWDGYTFDPASYIRAVNRLRGEEAPALLEQLRTYTNTILNGSAILEESAKVFFLVRLLFVTKKAGQPFPPIKIGTPLDSGTPPAKAFPLYPLALVEDVPLLIVSGFMLGGLPQSPLDHLDFCQKECRLRPDPLRPPDNPLSLADQLLTSKAWYRETQGAEGDDDRTILQAQLLRLVRSAYPLPDLDSMNFSASLQDVAVWQKHQAAFEQKKATWDSGQSRYQVAR